MLELVGDFSEELAEEVEVVIDGDDAVAVGVGDEVAGEEVVDVGEVVLDGDVAGTCDVGAMWAACGAVGTVASVESAGLFAAKRRDDEALHDAVDLDAACAASGVSAGSSGADCVVAEVVSAAGAAVAGGEFEADRRCVGVDAEYAACADGLRAADDCGAWDAVARVLAADCLAFGLCCDDAEDDARSAAWDAARPAARCTEAVDCIAGCAVTLVVAACSAALGFGDLAAQCW